MLRRDVDRFTVVVRLGSVGGGALLACAAEPFLAHCPLQGDDGCQDWGGRKGSCTARLTPNGQGFDCLDVRQDFKLANTMIAC
jgi:hypothetical protein